MIKLPSQDRGMVQVACPTSAAVNVIAQAKEAAREVVAFSPSFKARPGDELRQSPGAWALRGDARGSGKLLIVMSPTRLEDVRRGEPIV